MWGEFVIEIILIIFFVILLLIILKIFINLINKNVELEIVLKYEKKIVELL